MPAPFPFPFPLPLPERDSEDVLTLSEVAEILTVPVNTLRWWRQIGTGPEFVKIGRHLVTTVGDIRRFICEQRRTARTVLTDVVLSQPG